MTDKKTIIKILKNLDINNYCFVGSMKYEDIAKDADVVLAPEYSEKIDEIIRNLVLNYELTKKPQKRGKFLVSFEFKSGQKLDLIFSKSAEHFNFLCQIMSPSNEKDLVKFKGNILKIIAYLKNYSLDWQEGLFKLYPIYDEFPNKIKFIKKDNKYKIYPSSYFKYEFITNDLNEIAQILLDTNWETISDIYSLIEYLNNFPDLKEKIKDVFQKTPEFKKFNKYLYLFDEI